MDTEDATYDNAFTVSKTDSAEVTETMTVDGLYGFVQFNQIDVDEGDQARIKNWSDVAITITALANMLAVSAATLYVSASALLY